MLYPLKFRPRLKKRIWGGRLLSEKLGKRIPKDSVIGESWEISGVDCRHGRTHQHGCFQLLIIRSKCIVRGVRCNERPGKGSRNP